MVDVEPCPICGQRLPDPYALTLHVEEAHTDDSPFVVRDDEPATPSTASLPGYEEDMKEQQPQDETSMDANNQYALCPEEGCGEQLLLGDINEHLDLHEAEDVTFQEQNHQPTPSRSKAKDLSALHTAHSSSSPSRSSTKHKKIRSPSHTHSSHRRRVKRHSPAGKENNNRIGLGRKFLFWVANMSQGRPSKSLRNGSRLGASELGPYAYEDRMPAWLFKQLEDGPPMRQIKKLGRDGRYTVQEVVEGETSGVLPILSRLSALDPRVRTAYYCHPSVLQIGKAKNEGGFCGFRNLQMQVSYIQGAKAPGYEKFPGRTPGVLQLQDWIEKAWDQGICETSRAEIGQLLGTRKWIGTMEALALYHYMDIKVMARTFGDQHGRYAHQRLLDWVEDYFRSSAPHDLNKVVTTLKPPIYLQRPCHSMTIIGLERMRDGTRNLLVFDPLYCAPRIMQDMIDRGPQAIHVPNEKFMRLYRRHETKLYPYLDFEVLELNDPDLPQFPAWNVLARFTCPYVYAFFDVSSWCYEVYPWDVFHHLFPWFQYGAMFNVVEARFARTPFGPTFPGLCVPAVWARQTPEGERRRLKYDDWQQSGVAAQYDWENRERYRDSMAAAEKMAGMFMQMPTQGGHNGIGGRQWFSEAGYTVNRHGMMSA